MISNQKNNVGLGVDVVEINRISRIIDETPRFIDHTYNKNEIKYCKSSKRYVEHFATHFAAKEAVSKALGNGFSDGIGPKDIEVCHSDKGRPYVCLHGRAKEIAREKNIKSIPISLSFTNSDAVGFAIALTEGSEIENKLLNKNVNTMQELTIKFKEVKKLLENHNYSKKK